MKKKPSTKVTPETVFIRAHTAELVALIKDVKLNTGERTSTGAMVKAGRNYLASIKKIATLESELSSTLKQLHEARELLQRIYIVNSNLYAYGKKFVPGKYPQGELL